MKTVVVDKIASVTQACGLGHEVRIAPTDIPRRGRRGRGRRDPHQQGQLQHAGADQRPHGQGQQGRHRGRRARPSQGAVRLLGPRARDAQGRRHHPDAEHRRRARHLRLGQPRQGQAVRLPRARRRAAVPLSRRAHRRAGAGIGIRKLDYGATLDTQGVPVVALAGTCMEAGKTAAACAIVSRMRHRGLVVDAFKATGVSLRRDILAMEDAGARNTMIFTDLGIITTTRAVGPALTRTMLTELAAKKPDVIVYELGDGILGTYGVDAILDCDDIRKRPVHRHRAVGQRSGRRLGRRQAAARALPRRTLRCHRSLDRQRGRRRDHRAADERAGVQRDDQRRRARRPRDQGPRPRRAFRACRRRSAAIQPSGR